MSVMKQVASFFIAVKDSLERMMIVPHVVSNAFCAKIVRNHCAYPVCETSVSEIPLCETPVCKSQRAKSWAER